MDRNNDTTKPAASTPTDAKSSRPLKESRSPCIGERIRWITAHPWLTHCEKTIATSILSRAQDHDGEFCAWPSLATIATDSGVERRNLARLMDRISRSGVFKRIRGVRASTTYEFPRILPEYPEKPEKTLRTTTSSLRITTTPDDSGLPLGGHQDYRYPSGREYHPKTKEKTEEKRIQKPPYTPLVCGKEVKNANEADEEPESKTEPHPAEPSEHQAANEAWASLAEPYEPTPTEPAPTAPAHTRRARTVPKSGRVQPFQSSTLPLPLEEESSDYLPPEPAPVPKPKRHKYNGARAERFLDFWAVWNKKAAKLAAYKVWVAQGLDAMADEIIADVEQRQAAHGQWLRGYQPHPDRYLRNWQWEDDIVPERPNGRARPESDTDRYLRELNESIARGDAEERAAAGDFSGGDWFEGEVVARH